MNQQIWIGFLTMTLTLALAFIGLNRVNTARGAKSDALRSHTKGEPVMFVRPSAYREFQRTGTWPDHTRVVIVIPSSRTKAHPNQGSSFEGDVVGIPAALKDVERVGDKKWVYFNLMSDGKPTTAKTMSPDQFWNSYNKNGAVDDSFVQFYPTLKPMAKEKGNGQGVGAGR